MIGDFDGGVSFWQKSTPFVFIRGLLFNKSCIMPSDV